MRDEETVTAKAQVWNVVMLALLKAPIPYETVAPVIQFFADRLELPKAMQPNGVDTEVRADVSR